MDNRKERGYDLRSVYVIGAPQIVFSCYLGSFPILEFLGFIFLYFLFFSPTFSCKIEPFGTLYHI